MAKKTRTEPQREGTLRLLAQLMKGRTHTATSAAKELTMNREGALRVLKALHKHVPGIQKNDSSQPHVFSFSTKEIHGPSALGEHASFAAGISATFGAAFARLLRGTSYHSEFIKLRDTVVARLRTTWQPHFEDLGRKFIIRSGGEENLDDRSGLLDDIIEAVLKNQTVLIDYTRFDGSQKQLRVSPYSLVVYDGRLYVIGLRHNDERPLRSYRFARIANVERTDETFAYPSANEYNPDALLRESIGIFMGGEEPVRVRLLLAEPWAIYAHHHRWHESQTVRELPDGRVEVSLRVRPCPELEQWVLSFGENAEVIDPPDLREVIARRLRAAAAHYESAGEG